MMIVAAGLVGVLFGLGLIVAGMANPAKVLAFLDVAGAWDPSLALVMGGAIGVALPAFALSRRRERGWLGARWGLNRTMNAGLLLQGSNNVVTGNYIGTDATGLVALGNSMGGASFWDRATGNQIGSGLSGAGNVIAANVTDLLDRAEDPAKMIRMIILEMEETLVEVRASAARTWRKLQPSTSVRLYCTTSPRRHSSSRSRALCWGVRRYSPLCSACPGKLKRQ